jgi:uncharacterized protein (TIGR02266 family)
MNARGRTLHVIAPYGPLAHEVRLTGFEGRWTAHIVTLPNMIWVEPGGSRPLQFIASTARDAEAAAVDFIVKDCLSRGQKILEFDGIPPETTRPAYRRFEARVPLRFTCRPDLGADHVARSTEAGTANLSETGIFIATTDVVPRGARLSIDLRFPDRPLRLEGEVMWHRPTRSPGRPPGMGVRLVDPPEDYRERLRGIR